MSMTQINWYPGHMKKTKDLIKDNMKLIDIVLEIVDARIPLSSKNPDIEVFAKNKKKIIILNKSDLVNKRDLDKWKKIFEEQYSVNEVVELSAETGYNMKKLFSTIEEISKEKRERLKLRGIKTINTRLMVLGIPNVGKSKLINRIVGKSSAGVGNRPGFTKGKQWIKIKEGLELLDTPGILWPKFESEEVGINLAITGAIRDDILPIEDVACALIEKLIKLNKWDDLKQKYKLLDSDFNEISGFILEKIALRMAMLISGNRLNIEKAARTLLVDFRSGKLGKICLDF